MSGLGLMEMFVNESMGIPVPYFEYESRPTGIHVIDTQICLY